MCLEKEIITWIGERWWRGYYSLTATLAPIILERFTLTNSEANGEYHKNEHTNYKCQHYAKNYEKYFLCCREIIMKILEIIIPVPLIVILKKWIVVEERIEFVTGCTDIIPNIVVIHCKSVLLIERRKEK